MERQGVPQEYLDSKATFGEEFRQEAQTNAWSERFAETEAGDAANAFDVMNGIFAAKLKELA